MAEGGMAKAGPDLAEEPGQAATALFLRKADFSLHGRRNPHVMLARSFILIG